MKASRHLVTFATASMVFGLTAHSAAIAQEHAQKSTTAHSALSTRRLANLDRDNDGLPDRIELRAGTNPHSADSNGNGILDRDETIPSLGISFGEAFVRGMYDDGDSTEVEDDGDSNQSPGQVQKPITPPVHKPVCTRRNQRNCKAPNCSSSKKIKNSSFCRPTPITTPTQKPTSFPTTRPTSFPTSIPTARPTSTPTPVPTLVGNFDAGGNTTKFGIPAGMSGNISAGSSIQAANCNGCHGEKQARSFSQLKGSLSIGSMSYIKLSDAQLASLTAYLNRFY